MAVRLRPESSKPRRFQFSALVLRYVICYHKFRQPGDDVPRAGYSAGSGEEMGIWKRLGLLVGRTMVASTGPNAADAHTAGNSKPAIML